MVWVAKVWGLCEIPHKRHSFAVATLLDWYRHGEDVPALLTRLSTYLGHTDPKHTFWYLSAAPELLALAGQRLDTHLGGAAPSAWLSSELTPRWSQH
jgi:hypothetical protein